VVDKSGKVFVCDRENHRIQIFSADGDLITIWTDIQRPMDISIDSEGVFYVSEGSVDGSSARVSVLHGDGGVLARFDCRGSGHGSWVDSKGDIYVGTGSPGGIDKFVLS
jgi:sugar lactone lactonase YvrE